MNFVKRGILVVISSPSGAGKTTLARRLAERQKMHFSVSYTTRSRRPGEKDGEDYHFVSEERFVRMVNERAFAEEAFVHGHRYGTSIDTDSASFQRAITACKDLEPAGFTGFARTPAQQQAALKFAQCKLGILQSLTRRRGFKVEMNG